MRGGGYIPNIPYSFVEHLYEKLEKLCLYFSLAWKNLSNNSHPYNFIQVVLSNRAGSWLVIVIGSNNLALLLSKHDKEEEKRVQLSQVMSSLLGFLATVLTRLI